MMPPLALLLIALGAVSCLYVAKQERRTGGISVVRLALPVLGAAAVAFGLVMVDPAPPPKAMLAAALLAGLPVGTAVCFGIMMGRGALVAVRAVGRALS
jgi:hypothetical protein